MKNLLCTLLLPLCSCSTVIYDGNGGKLAAIYSDAKDVSLTKSGDGSITFAAASLDNSTPTKAVTSIARGAFAAWTTAQLLKDAPNTINAFTGNHPKP